VNDPTEAEAATVSLIDPAEVEVVVKGAVPDPCADHPAAIYSVDQDARAVKGATRELAVPGANTIPLADTEPLVT